MATNTKPADGALTLVEMKEFASFSAATQRYIRRSLDIGLGRRDAMRRWSRDAGEAASIRAQERIYRRLDHIRATPFKLRFAFARRVELNTLSFERASRILATKRKAREVGKHQERQNHQKKIHSAAATALLKRFVWT